MAYVNRALSFLLGSVVAVVGFVGSVEAVSTGLGHGWVWIPGRQWVATLRSTRWSATAVVITFAVLAAVGLVLLVAELKRRPRNLIELSLPDASAGQLWVVQRRSLEAQVVRAVLDTTSCSSMHCVLRYRRGAWRLDLWGSGPAGVEADVERTAKAALSSVGAPQPERVRVRVRPERQRNTRTGTEEGETTSAAAGEHSTPTGSSTRTSGRVQ